MCLHLFVLLLLATVQSANFTIGVYWANADCTGPLIFAATPIAANLPCNTSLTCTPFNAGSFKSVSTQCSIGAPDLPAGVYGWKTYLSNGNCQGEPNSVSGYGTGCINSTTVSYQVQCTNDGMTFNTYLNSGNCVGTPATAVYTYGCLQAGSTSIGQDNCQGGGGSGGAACFHKDTVITLKGEKLNFAALSAHPECAIPHVLKKNGLKISTQSTEALRLTRDHLVETRTGYVEAEDLKVGDELFFGTHPVKITHIELETNQEYFGLNCVESEVLANGYRTSTFGSYHAVPALWMKYASKFVGVATASAWGDCVASLVYQFGLL